MDWTLVFTAIGTVAAVISAIIAVRAKGESKRILEQIKEERSRNVKSKGNIRVSNNGNSSGILIGDNPGGIRK